MGVFTKLKVLLYTDKNASVRVAVVAALGQLILGRETAANPDDDLVAEICRLLKAEEEELYVSAAKLLGRMIYQDYVKLTVTLHEGKNLPQSDNWGLSDPFVRMSINGQEWESSVQRNTLTPVWEQTVQFSVSDKSDSLAITLYDWDLSGEDLLGEINFSCEMLAELGEPMLRRIWASSQADEANQIMAKANNEVRNSSGYPINKFL